MLWWGKKEKKCKNKKLLYCVIDPENYKVGQKIIMQNSEFTVVEIKKFSWLKTSKGIRQLFALMVERTD
jgi:hypothetical protein